MSRRRASSIRFASPEALFLFGGEEAAPFYPVDPSTITEWGDCVPYDRASASIERMQHTGLGAVAISKNLSQRDDMVEQITSRIIGAEEIEKQRQNLASDYRAMLLTNRGETDIIIKL